MTPSPRTRAGASTRRPANRRKKRPQHLLDVNIRVHRAKSQRNQRIILFVCKVLLVLGILVGVAYGIREGLNRLFFANPTYTLNHIDVDIDGTLNRDQVLQSVALRTGVNIFSVKLPVARQALLDIPQVEDAEIQRLLPDTLKITIRERQPVARLIADRAQIDTLTPAQTLMLDASGIVLKSRANLPEYTRLPVITGYPTDGLRLGKPVEAAEVMSALTLLKKTGEELPGRYDIQTIDLSKGWCMDVADRSRSAIRFSFEDLDSQVRRLGLLLDYCDKNHQQIATVNLTIKRNVPVTFVQSEAIATDGASASKSEFSKPTELTGENSLPVRKALPANKKKGSKNGKG
ncbi:MAG TPA: FtsQ-type POTRA domain-containing protein [Chthoniobacterales bacterium]